jgi:hypothetical protein
MKMAAIAVTAAEIAAVSRCALTNPATTCKTAATPPMISVGSS